MRLNRVLQRKLSRVYLLTAGMAVAMAATVFTISCGEDGSDGKEGTDCIITGSSAPFEVFCGGLAVGSLTDGANGPDGTPGANGQQGAQGKSCVVNKQGTAWQIVCGGEPKGVLDGCKIEQSTTNINEIAVNCGETHVDLCGAYVLAKDKVCSETAAQNEIKECGKSKTAYNDGKQYCGFANKAAHTAGTPTPIDLCGVTSTTNKPNNAAQLIVGTDTTWVFTDTTTADDGDFNAWKDQYCKVTRGVPTDYEKESLSTMDTKAKAEPDTCGSSLSTKYNEGAWKGEYCGYKSGSTTKEKLSDGCSNGEKPNETAASDYYCQMEAKTHKYAKKKNDYCFSYTVALDKIGGVLVKTQLPNTTKQPINRIDDKPNVLLTEANFLNQYCGYTAANFEKTRISITDINDPNHSKPDTAYVTRIDVATNICTNGKGINEDIAVDNTVGALGTNYQDSIQAYLIAQKAGTSPFPVWKNQYCVATFAGTTTAPTGGADAYCMEAGNIGSSGNDKDLPKYTKGATKDRLNENTWKGQYCGYKTAADFYNPVSGKTSTADPIRSNFIADADDPSTYGATIPSVMVSCDSAKKDIVKSSTGFNAPNEKSNVESLKYWPNQYCQYGPNGFSKVAGIQATVTEITNIASAVFPTAFTAILDNFCVQDTNNIIAVTNFKDYNEDYLKKFQGRLTTDSKYTISKLNDGSWKNGGQYCGIKDSIDFKNGGAAHAATTGSTAHSVINGVCVSTNGTVAATQPNSWKRVKSTTLTDWPNEYCQFDKSGDATVVGMFTYSGVPETASLRSTMDLINQVYCLGDTSGYLGATNKAYFYNSKVADGQRLNKGSWKREYCGFSQASDMGSSTAKPKHSRIGALAGIAGVCDDDNKPNEVKTAYTVWNNEYCQADSYGKTWNKGGSDNYCGTATEEAWKAATSNNRLNEGSWKGQFCFADNAIGTCTGGQTFIPSAKSTDTPKCRMP